MNDLFPIGGDGSKKTQTCHACGQKIRKLNPHGIDKSKIRVLDGIGRIHRAGYRWARIVADPRGILKDERAFSFATDDVHVSRLRWFGLVETQSKRSGLYRLTEQGWEFLLGRATVPLKIYCRDGVVKQISEERVLITQVKGTVYDKAYWDSYPMIQRYPDEV